MLDRQLLQFLTQSSHRYLHAHFHLFVTLLPYALSSNDRLILPRTMSSLSYTWVRDGPILNLLNKEIDAPLTGVDFEEVLFHHCHCANFIQFHCYRILALSLDSKMIFTS